MSHFEFMLPSRRSGALLHYPMKIYCSPLPLLFCMSLSSCIPGKFASGVEGVLVDKKSTMPVSGALLESRIPHRDCTSGAPTASIITDEEGRFSFPPVYGVYKLLMMSADWREIAVSKNGYEPIQFSISHRDGVRMVSPVGDSDSTQMSQREPLRISIIKTKDG